MKVLCVAEKPSIAKSVAGTLSGGSYTTRNGFKYCKNFDFTFNFSWGQSSVTMTSITGHLQNLDFGPEYGWNNIQPNRLFDVPVSVVHIGDASKLADNITREARNCDLLMIWTDCDREGEYIGFEIVQAARKFNSRITMESTLRARFSHLERNHILNAAKNPVKIDQKQVEAVAVRQELDLRTGVSFTRFLTHLFKGKFRNLFEEIQVISYGNCQFPTLGFVVDRFKRVKAFVPEDFWYISVETRKNNSKVNFVWQRPHFFDRLAGVLIYETCIEMSSDKARVTSVNRKPTSNWRPLPLTTVELQKDCSRYFKLSAKDALAAAEQLYNKGFVSYPRTETDRFPQAMDLKGLVEKQNQSPAWGGYSRKLLTEDKFRQPRAGNHDDKAHPPIHPICFLGPSDKVSQREKQVYEYIARRFLACCSDDAKGESSTVSIKWGTEFFSASGLTVLERNYLDVYPYYKWESSKPLPKFEVEEEVKLSVAELQNGKTAPPSYLTESELIALMDKNGIGTDATIAEHIEKIIARKYVDKVTGRGKSAHILPTELGYGLVEGFLQMGFDNMNLSKPFLRKRLEDKLTDICEGRVDQAQVKSELIELYREAFLLSNQNQSKLVDAYNKVRGGDPAS